MSSIPTNAFSAPRVRWVMQQKLRDEQQKKQAADGGSIGTEGLDGDVKKSRRMSENNSLDENRSATNSAGSMDSLGESSFRPIFQRMQSATLMDSFRNYLPVTIPRPDFGRSLSHMETPVNRNLSNENQTAAPAGIGNRGKSRWSAFH